jgi:predicted nucleotidyltransferase
MTPLVQGPDKPRHQLHLSESELTIVKTILEVHLPGRKIWAFGSRATGVRLKRFSDLDLAIDGNLSLLESARLSEAFDESSLPMKVDVVPLEGMSSEFLQRVERDFSRIL